MNNERRCAFRKGVQNQNILIRLFIVFWAIAFVMIPVAKINAILESVTIKNASEVFLVG